MWRIPCGKAGFCAPQSGILTDRMSALSGIFSNWTPPGIPGAQCQRQSGQPTRSKIQYRLCFRLGPSSRSHIHRWRSFWFRIRRIWEYWMCLHRKLFCQLIISQLQVWLTTYTQCKRPLAHRAKKLVYGSVESILHDASRPKLPPP